MSRYYDEQVKLWWSLNGQFFNYDKMLFYVLVYFGVWLGHRERVNLSDDLIAKRLEYYVKTV